MKYRYIGRSGLRVSPIALGTMTFGTQSTKKEAFAIMDKAYEAGINFFDTAELYPVPPTSPLAGLTESIIGEWLQNKPRDSIILASKVAGAANGWFVPPIRHGLTAIDRFHIQKAVEGSLRRLKTDYLDLYQIHWPDQNIPIEESLEAMNHLIDSGKVRYLGTSNDTAHGVTRANTSARYLGLNGFHSVQNNFSLLNRRDLDSLKEVYEKEKISLLPYSPLAGGVLTGKYNADKMPEPARFTAYVKNKNKRVQEMAQRFLNKKTLDSTEQYIAIAKQADMSVTTLATAWSMHFDFVASTIIGASVPEQLDDSLAALDVQLSNEILTQCNEVHQNILYPMG
jgi:aryl-alcohol dehydrogenase-like predicted oxidoreductase